MDTRSFPAPPESFVPVVIGGGLSRAGGALFDELRRRLAGRLSFHRIPVLVPAELSGNAGLLGAALRARELT